MIKLIIKLLSFIPWIIYLINISSINEKKNESFLKVINTKELLLYILFIVFVQFKNTFALELLFAGVYIYLFIDFLIKYEDKKRKVKFNKRIFCATILIALLIAFFLVSNHLYTTYHFMFIVSLLSPYLFKKIFKN